MKITSGLKIFLTLSLIFTITLLIFSILQINFLAFQIYSLKSYEKKLKNLEIENETLKIDFSKSNSLVNLENHFSNQDFEKADPSQIKYIKILEREIVTK